MENKVEFLSKTGLKVTSSFVIDYDDEGRVIGGHFV